MAVGALAGAATGMLSSVGWDRAFSYDASRTVAQFVAEYLADAPADAPGWQPTTEAALCKMAPRTSPG